MKYSYEIQSYCPKKNMHRSQMLITRKDDDEYQVIIRHSFDRHGQKEDYYHIYSKEELTEGMEFRKREDKWGDYYHVRLSREQTINLFGEEAIRF